MRAFTREIGLQGGYGIEMDQERVLTEAIDRLLSDLDQPENKELLGWLLRFAEVKVEDGGEKLQSIQRRSSPRHQRQASPRSLQGHALWHHPRGGKGNSGDREDRPGNHGTVWFDTCRFQRRENITNVPFQSMGGRRNKRANHDFLQLCR